MVLTPIYAALAAMLFVVLSIRVIAARRAMRVPLGDGADGELMRRIRVHANFAEYTPIALVLLMLAEMQGAPHLFVHAAGTTLLVGRTVHAVGVSRTPEDFRLRVTGMAMTLTVIVSCALRMLAVAVGLPGIGLA